MADFRDTVDALLAGDGIVQTDREHLAGVVRGLLDDATRRRQLADNGRAVLRAQQGATGRNTRLIESLLPPGKGASP